MVMIMSEYSGYTWKICKRDPFATLTFTFQISFVLGLHKDVIIWPDLIRIPSKTKPVMPW